MFLSLYILFPFPSRYNVHELALHGRKDNIPQKIADEARRDPDIEKESSQHTCENTSEPISPQIESNEVKKEPKEIGMEPLIDSVTDSQKDSKISTSIQVKSEREIIENALNCLSKDP